MIPNRSTPQRRAVLLEVTNAARDGAGPSLPSFRASYDPAPFLAPDVSARSCESRAGGPSLASSLGEWIPLLGSGLCPLVVVGPERRRSGEDCNYPVLPCTAHTTMLVVRVCTVPAALATLPYPGTVGTVRSTLLLMHACCPMVVWPCMPACLTAPHYTLLPSCAHAGAAGAGSARG
jgi:hypothetical protein